MASRINWRETVKPAASSTFPFPTCNKKPTRSSSAFSPSQHSYPSFVLHKFLRSISSHYISHIRHYDCKRPSRSPFRRQRCCRSSYDRDAQHLRHSSMSYYMHSGILQSDRLAMYLCDQAHRHHCLRTVQLLAS